MLAAQFKWRYSVVFLCSHNRNSRKMGQKCPEWLNENYLTTVLQGGEDNEPAVTILNFSVKPALAVGNNYTSDIYRVLVEYKTKQSGGDESVSLIVKVPIGVGAIHELTEGENIPEKEKNIYSQVLPKMFQKINCEFGPKSFYSPVKRILILKDMKTDGYVMCDRFKQLDLSHCKHVFDTIAKFHATSVALHHDNPQFIEGVGEENLYKHGGPFEDCIKHWTETSVQYTADILNEIGGQQTTVDLLLSKIDQIWDTVVDICSPRTSRLNVLNHGDCWVNNMLFQHNDSGEVVNLKLIDFQITRYASPVLDLTYFLWCSANEEVRKNHHQELYNIYLQTLNKTLEELGCEERITAEDLNEDLKSATDWVLVLISFVLPFILCEPEDAIDMGSIKIEEFKTIRSNEKFIKMYSGKHYREKLPVIARQVQAWISSFE